MRGWLIAVILLGTSLGQTRERLGELELTDFLLEPSFTYSEPKSGQFEVGNSLLQATWKRDATISGVITVGNKSLLGIPARYEANPTNELTFVEAYGQADTTYGRFSLGLIPLPFGTERAGEEGHLRFERSLLYRKRLVGLRDIGATYQITHNGFFSEWAIHNGESGKDLDGQTWFTATWGWRGIHALLGFSGMTGRTTPQSTNPSGTNNTTTAALDVNRMAKFRAANFFYVWEGEPFSAKVEATLGETFQDLDRFKFNAGHVDLYYTTTPSFGFLLRYDTFDPRSDLQGDRIQEATVGIAWRSRYETSALYLYGTKVFQENVSPDVHRFMLTWRLTPYILSRR